MPDIRIRKNEHCVIGLPACDYVFSSTRSCFIAHGFHSSSLEKDILQQLLKERGIEAVEAGDRLEPGKFAFCTKICSKIITSQFCVVLVNNDFVEVAGAKHETPNANANMEYGLMLGHNKYLIPFQLDSQKLPFNVAGLDTIKYNTRNFRDLAAKALDQAIAETTQGTPTPSTDQIINSFLLIKDATVVNINTSQGERSIFELGSPFGFNLLIKFDGLSYVYLGNFAALRTEAIVWRVTKLAQLIVARLDAIQFRLRAGLADEKAVPFLEIFQKRLEMWLIVNTPEQRIDIDSWMHDQQLPFIASVFDMKTVIDSVSKMP